MSPVPGLTEKIAVKVVASLLMAAAGAVRKRLSQSETRKALEAAVAEALDEALESQELVERDENWGHYGSLLEEFFTREEATFELAQLLDPRPDQTPDLATLVHEFRMAGYVPETMPGFEPDSFLRAFFSAFYAAACVRDILRGGIELKVLGSQLQQLGIVAEASLRIAKSVGQIEASIQRLVAGNSDEEPLRRLVGAAVSEGFMPAYRTLEEIRTGLLKAGLDLGVDSQGTLEIVGRGSEASRALPPARLEAVRLLAGDLLRTVDAHEPTEDELNALDIRYRQHVIRWFESLTFQGMMRAPKPIVLPLEDVYVELRAVAEVPEAADAFSVEERRLLVESEEKDESKKRELMSQLDTFRRERWSRTLPERKSMAEALHQRDRRAFVILGDPGSGKTTLLHFLALVYARGPETAVERLGVDLAEADRLPIFVPLAAFDDMLRESQREGLSLTLLDFLPRYYARRRSLPSLEPLFRRALESGRALVLFDGLDEVLDVGTRTYVAQQAGAFIGEWSARGVRFVVSSRFVGYREAPVPGNLPTLSVLDFGTPEIETFVRRWAHAFEKWAANGVESPEMLRKAHTLETDLMVDVESNDCVRRLAANPLMLTMLALLRRQVGRLPHRRVQLYESYIGTLLENWVEARSEGAREKALPILDQYQAESILIPLALWLQQEKPSGTAGRVEIRNKLVEICLAEKGIDEPEKAERPAVREAEKEADRFLQEMREMAGLIIERGHDAFGFLHLTFQEYFAGRALAQLGDDKRWEAILPNLHEPRWREPILLCAGRLGVVENRREQVTKLVRDILEHEDPVEADLHRNLLCALSIACDDVNLEPKLVTDLVGRAIALLSTRTPALVRELLRLLGQLVANKMADFGACLTPVEATWDYNLKFAAIEEWSRFVEIEQVGAWMWSQLDSQRVAGKALNALGSRIDEDNALRQKVLDLLELAHSLSAAPVLPRIVAMHADIRKALLKNLEKSSSLVRVSSLNSLADLVTSDLEIRRLFVNKLRDADEYVRWAAVEGLANLVRDDLQVQQAMLERLEDISHLVKTAATKALAGNLDRNHEALCKIVNLLECSRRFGLANYLTALGSAVARSRQIEELFLEQVRTIDWRSRQAACEGLAQSGLASPEILRVVLNCQASESSNVMIIEDVRRALKRKKRLGLIPPVWEASLSVSGGKARSCSCCDAIVNLENIYHGTRLDAVEELSEHLGEVEVNHAIRQRLNDAEFSVRLKVVEVVTRYQEEDLFESVRASLWTWLDVDFKDDLNFHLNERKVRSVQEQLARRFGARLPADSSLCADLLEKLHEPRWSARLGAVLALLAWPGGPPEDVLTQVLAALGDRRGLEAYPAQLTAASYLINRNETAAEAINLCMEALKYGTQPWESLNNSPAVRRQAALVLGKLEPVSYEPRIWDKLLHVLRHDKDASVRDAAYGTLVRLARFRDRQDAA
jgi:NACHT domain/HEAT repeats